MSLKNPLPYELKLSDMRLLTNGIVFESHPETFMLQALSSSTITLRGTPIEHGSLEINGYSTHTLGVKSNCRLKHMNHDRERVLSQFPPMYKLNVIPALPNLEITTSCPPMDTLACITNTDNVIASTNITLYCGETTECILTLTNNSNIAIEFLEETMQSSLDAKTQNLIFSWSKDEIQSQLPIKPNKSLTINLKISGYADFLGPINVGSALNGVNSIMSSNQNGHIGNDAINSLSGGIGYTSLPSRMSSPINFPKRSEFSSSFRSKAYSNNSGHSSLVTYSQGASGSQTRQLDAQFRFRYSGGEGFKENYCRNCAVLFNMEFLSSAQITNWDVLPAETYVFELIFNHFASLEILVKSVFCSYHRSNQFYLVLDVTNLTAQEMMLNYTLNKNIVIEARESCRVPVPVERCPLFHQDTQQICDETENSSSKIIIVIET